MHSVSPQQLRRGSVAGQPNMSNTFNTPSQGRAQTTTEYSLTSPQHVTTPHSHGSSMPSFGSPQVLSQRRGSAVTQTPPSGRSGGSSRMSFSSNMRAPSLRQDPNTQSLTGISQILAVQEMAFRQGQHDAGVSRERIPTSPFAMHFNQVWAEFYALGKECGGMPKSSSLSLTNAAATHNNFYWPVLINPYTQDLEHPNGAVDTTWVSTVFSLSFPSHHLSSFSQTPKTDFPTPPGPQDVHHVLKLHGSHHPRHLQAQRRMAPQHLRRPRSDLPGTHVL
jgi:hypothetical protein